MPAQQDWVRDLHRSSNRSTRGRRSIYSPHRRRVMALIQPHLSLSRDIVILGAGNSNDIDLPLLLGSCASVELVDLDSEALEAGVHEWGCRRHPALTLRGDVDVTGGLEDSHAPGRHPLSAAALTRTFSQEVVLDLDQRDVVLSTGLLSQVLLTALELVDEGDPDVGSLIHALISGHISSVVRLVRPGGWGIITIELVSSETLREIASPIRSQLNLQSLASRAIFARNHFRGLDPQSVLDCVRSLTAISGRLEAMRLIEPWLWQMTPTRSYLVYALEFRVRAATTG